MTKDCLNFTESSGCTSQHAGRQNAKELRYRSLDHQTEDDRYKPEGIDLDSDKINTHRKLNGNMHWVYEHKGLE
jgi:hypothetical protein